MGNYFEIFVNAFKGYGDYLWRSVTNFRLEGDLNYFYFLIIISLLVWGLEYLFPGEKSKVDKKRFLA